MSDILDLVPKLTQRQDDVLSQLQDLHRVANKMGMYDAADALAQKFLNVSALDIRYGCHVDLDPDEEPDHCVIDEGRPQDCIYAQKGIRKEQCEYWRIVTPKLKR